MTIPSLNDRSPLGTYLEHCRKGGLAYQVCTDDGAPVFFPRVVAPGTGSGNLEWRVSKGLGTVYSTTVVHYRNESPLNVALIDLDEGFRMMANVLGPDPEGLAIGDRVRVVFEARGDLALPQFERSRGPAAAGP